MRYADDLAYIHHTGFADLARGASPFLVDLLRRRRLHGSVVDLGCGSGIVLRALVDAGYDHVIGVDLSNAMLQIARKTAPTATFVHSSLYTAPLPKRCAAVFAVGEPLNYVEPNGSAPAVAPLFRKVARSIADDGVFVFDVIVDGPGRSLTRRGWSAGADWACLVDTKEDDERRRLIRDITMFVKHKRAFVRSHELHHVRIFRTNAIVGALRAAGFAKVRVMTSYGAHPLAVRRRAFIAGR